MYTSKEGVKRQFADKFLRSNPHKMQLLSRLILFLMVASTIFFYVADPGAGLPALDPATLARGTLGPTTCCNLRYMVDNEAVVFFVHWRRY